LYQAIKYCSEEYHYPIETACKILHVSRSAYYKWLRGDFGARTVENERIADLVEKIHNEVRTKGTVVFEMIWNAIMTPKLTTNAF